MDTEYNEEMQRNKVKAGMMGGNMFKNPNLAPSMTIIDKPSELTAKQMGGETMQSPVSDPWVVRYPGSKMK